MLSMKYWYLVDFIGYNRDIHLSLHLVVMRGQQEFTVDGGTLVFVVFYSVGW